MATTDTVVVKLQDALAEAQALAAGAPPPPPPPPPGGNAVFTANVAQSTNVGTNATPAYESVLYDPQAEIFYDMGWIGIHAAEYSNAVKRFNPATLACDIMTPWQKQVSSTDTTLIANPTISTGFNRNHATYDNHPTCFLPVDNQLAWLGHGVVDIATAQHIRGSRYPQTQAVNTYITGDDPLTTGQIFNPAYALCMARNEVAFYGASAGGSGNKQSLAMLRRTGPANAPWQVSRFNLASFGIRPMERARNNAVCVGSKMYVGGGTCDHTWSVTNSVFTVNDSVSAGLIDGAPFNLYPSAGNGQSDMPSGMTFGTTYYIRDKVGDTFRIAATVGGAAMTVGNKSGGAVFGNYDTWLIDLASLPNATRVSQNHGAHVSQSWPQLTYDSLRKRLVLVGKVVTALDLDANGLPVNGTWYEVAVQNWNTVGYKFVSGGYVASLDAVFFRGTRLNYDPNNASLGGIDPWAWNRIQFS